ncbi:MAG: ATP/GTP-binding protein [Rhodoferax sp.]
MNEYKILITGSMGAGKTTAIAAISEIPPIMTDVQNNDSSHAKLSTTVGLDYGEMTLDGGDKLRLYGTPGQERFSFMWKVLAQGALGLIVLVDNSRPDPLADLAAYLNSFHDLIDRAGCVIAVGRTETHPSPSLDGYADFLQEKGVLSPLLPIDVRNQDEVLGALELLLLQFESKNN